MITITDAVDDSNVLYTGYHLLIALTAYKKYTNNHGSVNLIFSDDKVKERWIKLLKNL